MRALPLVVASMLLLVAPMALVPTAAADGDTDFTITLRPDAPPLYSGPAGWFILESSEDGARYSWGLDLPDGYVVGDVRIPDGLFAIERVQQVVPMVDVAVDHYPLFHPFPRDDVWNVDSPAQVYRFIDDGTDTVLRLGFPGPMNGTFALERDVTPPSFELGPVKDRVHHGFYQETTTDELALADLRVRPVDGGLERENPTTSFAYLQKFPVKGLDPETRYDAWVVFEDWAGNTATSETYTVTTPPRPLAPVPTITPLAPLPDATGVDPTVTIEVAIEAASAESVDDVRLFLDLRPIETGWTLTDGVLRYTPPAPLEDGPHRVSVEVDDVHGNRYHEQWSFRVGVGQDDLAGEAAGPGLGSFFVVLLASLTLLAAAQGHRRRL